MDGELDYSNQYRDWNEISHTERYFPAINNQVILQTPHGGYKLTFTEKVAIGIYFWGLLGLEASATLIGTYLPDQVKRWGSKGR